jgi:hypothetical protein
MWVLLGFFLPSPPLVDDEYRFLLVAPNLVSFWQQNCWFSKSQFLPKVLG